MAIGIDHHEQQGRSAMSVPLPPHLAHRRNVRPRLGIAVCDLEAVPPGSRPSIGRQDALLLRRRLVPTSLRCVYPLQKSTVQRGLSPLAFPLCACTSASASPPSVVSGWCQLASSPTMRHISIPTIRLIYAE